MLSFKGKPSGLKSSQSKSLINVCVDKFGVAENLPKSLLSQKCSWRGNNIQLYYVPGDFIDTHAHHAKSNTEHVVVLIKGLNGSDDVLPSILFLHNFVSFKRAIVVNDAAVQRIISTVSASEEKEGIITVQLTGDEVATKAKDLRAWARKGPLPILASTMENAAFALASIGTLEVAEDGVLLSATLNIVLAVGDGLWESCQNAYQVHPRILKNTVIAEGIQACYACGADVSSVMHGRCESCIERRLCDECLLKLPNRKAQVPFKPVSPDGEAKTAEQGGENAQESQDLPNPGESADEEGQEETKDAAEDDDAAEEQREVSQEDMDYALEFAFTFACKEAKVSDFPMEASQFFAGQMQLYNTARFPLRFKSSGYKNMLTFIKGMSQIGLISYKYVQQQLFISNIDTGSELLRAFEVTSDLRALQKKRAKERAAVKEARRDLSDMKKDAAPLKVVALYTLPKGGGVAWPEHFVVGKPATLGTHKASLAAYIAAEQLALPEAKHHIRLDNALIQHIMRHADTKGKKKKTNDTEPEVPKPRSDGLDEFASYTTIRALSEALSGMCLARYFIVPEALNNKEYVNLKGKGSGAKPEIRIKMGKNSTATLLGLEVFGVDPEPLMEYCKKRGLPSYMKYDNKQKRDLVTFRIKTKRNTNTPISVIQQVLKAHWGVPTSSVVS